MKSKDIFHRLIHVPFISLVMALPHSTAKKPTFMFSRELEEGGFKNGTWNFHESGHGKGAPDGIGGALKRAANLKVLHGKDIL